MLGSIYRPPIFLIFSMWNRYYPSISSSSTKVCKAPILCHERGLADRPGHICMWAVNNGHPIATYLATLLLFLAAKNETVLAKIQIDWLFPVALALFLK